MMHGLIGCGRGSRTRRKFRTTAALIGKTAYPVGVAVQLKAIIAFASHFLEFQLKSGAPPYG
jgi:hypothetical protein